MYPDKGNPGNLYLESCCEELYTITCCAADVEGWGGVRACVCVRVCVCVCVCVCV
jgi:hypothetical protein